MKSLVLEHELHYDGSQLHSLFAYLNYGVLGDSIISWIGSCDVKLDHMVDGEDRLARAEIRSDKMLHFIVEQFDQKLLSAVSLQRLISELCIDLMCELNSALDKKSFQRRGDDIYYNKNFKLNISIATVSPSSTLIHYAINVTNSGTPVKTTCLEDLSVPVKELQKQMIALVQKEVESMKRATQKVCWVK